ncbi:HET-domain-containing protein [Lepidopterella palustris CBS 459.81]|uniref:HET-domain-containing protein n=1 Tax=Lepidopterella palustris CBS 459.81 TaxID=1314670 RepID=A0A8E2JET5_9PEZI|nr:HET-domain-containing protein [Lepidopterella palustris CBS 459.81]
MGYIPLTLNLYIAIHNLRNAPDLELKTFWIDQICINQNDLQERGHQVALMFRIYSGASQVITYIGPEKSTDKDAIDLTMRIHDIVKPHFRDLLFAVSWNQKYQIRGRKYDRAFL